MHEMLYNIPNLAHKMLNKFSIAQDLCYYLL